jgi:hypothetical protein
MSPENYEKQLIEMKEALNWVVLKRLTTSYGVSAVMGLFTILGC